jgi:hypothetical protein
MMNDLDFRSMAELGVARNANTMKCSGCLRQPKTCAGWASEFIPHPDPDEPGEILPRVYCPACAAQRGLEPPMNDKDIGPLKKKSRRKTSSKPSGEAPSLSVRTLRKEQSLTLAVLRRIETPLSAKELASILGYRMLRVRGHLESLETLGKVRSDVEQGQQLWRAA